MTKTYYDILYWQQMVCIYMYKAEKTYLNDLVIIGIFVLNMLLQINYKRQDLKIC